MQDTGSIFQDLRNYTNVFSKDIFGYVQHIYVFALTLIY